MEPRLRVFRVGGPGQPVLGLVAAEFAGGPAFGAVVVVQLGPVVGALAPAFDRERFTARVVLGVDDPDGLRAVVEHLDPHHVAVVVLDGQDHQVGVAVLAGPAEQVGHLQVELVVLPDLGDEGGSSRRGW
jgi:hypothetical protein